jgi:hypothetical protein
MESSHVPRSKNEVTSVSSSKTFIRRVREVMGKARKNIKGKNTLIKEED